MLLKKYSIMLLTAVLCLTITILTDILFGFPWYNFIINWRFTLFSPVERITVILLLALLVIPDLYRSFRKRKHETSPLERLGNRIQEPEAGPEPGPGAEPERLPRMALRIRHMITSRSGKPME